MTCLFFQTLDDMQSKTKNYLRLYSEQSFLRKEPDCHQVVLEAMRLGGESISERYDDHSVSGIYWEALFFSGVFDLQQKAEAYVKSRPKMASGLDIDKLVARATRAGSVELLTSLMELTLQLDMEEYDKSRAFEGVIVKHCEKYIFDKAS